MFCFHIFFFFFFKDAECEVEQHLLDEGGANEPLLDEIVVQPEGEPQKSQEGPAN